MGNKSNLCHKTVISLFVLIILTISVVTLILPEKVYSEQENRYLATLPQFSWDTLVSGEYGKDLESALADQFPMRDSWITAKTLLSMTLLKNEINGIYIGSDGYLIERHTDTDIDDEQAAKNLDTLLQFVNKYYSNGTIKVMPIPTAEMILTNKLPFYANGFDQIAWLKELAKKLDMQNNSNALIDMTEELSAHQDEYIYYATDHHWTGLGAYYGYREYVSSLGISPIDISEWDCKKVTDEFYGTLYSKVHMNRRPDSIYLYEFPGYSSYEVVYNMGEATADTMYELEKLETKDKYAVFFGGNPALVEIETGADSGRSLLVIKDSYANSMIPFLIPHFEKITVVDLRYFNVSLSNYIDSYEFTDVLLLYNIPNFLNENTVTGLIK